MGTTSLPIHYLFNLEENDVQNDKVSEPTIPEEDTGLHQNISTSHQSQRKEDLPTIPEEDEDEIDPADQETLVFDSKQSEDECFDTAVDITAAFISDLVQIPTEQLGCLQVTHKLQEFLEQYPPKSKEKAFEHIYQILQVLDKYLVDNPKQHQHCMSPDSEYITFRVLFSLTMFFCGQAYNRFH